jgi:hypothetical protein
LFKGIFHKINYYFSNRKISNIKLEKRMRKGEGEKEEKTEKEREKTEEGKNEMCV